MDKMSFDEFTAALLSEIENYANERGNKEIRRETITKLTGSYESISVYDKTTSLGMCININDLYKKYENDEDFDQLKKCVRESLDDVQPEITLEDVKNYDSARLRLFIRVSNIKGKEEFLKDKPYLLCNDEFAITAHMVTQWMGNTLGSAIVNNSLLEVWGISKEQLFGAAKKNSVRLFPPMMMECRMDETHCLCTLTNERKLNGAAVMFYEGMWDQLLDSFDCDLLVIPSSIHEMMLLPYRDEKQIVFYKDVLHNANQTCVDPGEDLSENIYLLTREKRTLEKAG